ncbi:hypothetical protein SESBI_22153 [Sesbania bispinosa]|nr:hypothetical protein SESBI_22153 [Sesbania bispinosa]
MLSSSPPPYLIRFFLPIPSIIFPSALVVVATFRTTSFIMGSSIRPPPFKVTTKKAILYQLLYLIHQSPAIFCVMSPIPMIITLFIHVGAFYTFRWGGILEGLTGIHLSRYALVMCSKESNPLPSLCLPTKIPGILAYASPHSRH